MRKILSFSLSGKFAHFNFPFTNKKYLKKSYSIPPRTTILGLLGAIIGLKGFQDFDNNLPEYYEKLHHIPLAICLSEIPIKNLVKYNSLNSFADNSKDGNNVIMQEEILLNPRYNILLILDESIIEDQILLEKLCLNPQSIFPIYLGKNEFFAEISEVEIFEEKEFEREEINKTKRLKSIIPSKYSSKGQIENPQELLGNAVLDSFSYDIDFTDKKLKTKYTEVIYFLDKEEVRGSLVFDKKINLLNLKGSHYFFFEDEIFRDL